MELAREITMGASTTTVALLDMTLVSKVAMRYNALSITTGPYAPPMKIIWSASNCAAPVFSRAVPKLSDPASRRITFQLMLL